MKSVFITLVCLVTVDMLIADNTILWQQEFGCDSNSGCWLGAILADSKNNEVIILGTSEQTDTKQTNFHLWKTDLNGNVTQKRSLCYDASVRNRAMILSLGIRTAVNPDTGDIIGLNMFAEDDANGDSISFIGSDMQSRKVELCSKEKGARKVLFKEMIHCRDECLLLVGRDNDSNGIVIKTNLAGNMVWEKKFDYGQTDILNSIVCAPDGKDFYVAGISASMAGEMMLAGPATVCVLRYDSNGELKASDFFEGGTSPWPLSFPKVICLPSGRVLVVYDKSKNGMATELCVKAYTRELTLLWEKQILKTKENSPPVFFDICATGRNQFVFAGVIDIKDLRLYECDADGAILQTLESDSAAGGGGSHISVNYLAERIFVAFAARTQDTDEVKIKLLALKSHVAN